MSCVSDIIKFAGLLTGILAFANPAYSAAYRVIHSFPASNADGQSPATPLVAVNGQLFGTTPYGGSFSAGIVFRISPAGAEHVVHAFGYQLDGQVPTSGLTVLGSNLYGTTMSSGRLQGCGTCGYGVAYAIAPDGAERVFYSFVTNPDNAFGGLLSYGGLLYGTVPGNFQFNGDVFSLTTRGDSSVLHYFAGQPSDGGQPTGALVASPVGTAPLFFGTTAAGGVYNAGTVYSISPEGNSLVLYSFGAVPGDASFPVGVYPTATTLFGVAEFGGAGACNQGCGAVFAISPTGTETLLHSFKATDGAYPLAGLAAISGVYYGTTSAGGAYGQGTLYSIAPDGTFAVLHDFGGGKDGGKPAAALIDVSGTLYGTTMTGGAQRRGTVFAYTP